MYFNGSRPRSLECEQLQQSRFSNAIFTKDNRPLFKLAGLIYELEGLGGAEAAKVFDGQQLKVCGRRYICP